VPPACLLQDIAITGVTVFADPFLEMEQAEADQAAAEAKKVGSKGGLDLWG
jgi:hypothetical protein